MKKYLAFVLLFLLGVPVWAVQNFIGENDSIYAGFRASRLYHIYPDNKFPPKEYWVKVGNQMADKFDDAQPAGIWIVGLFMDNGHVSLGFPNPGGEYDDIDFADEDLNEDYLTYFDEHNIKVWLQVEPGSVNIDTLMDLVMQRYRHHPSVIGFGIDIEWYKADVVEEGAKVTDDEAEHWDAALHQIDTAYSLFIKHYNTDWMPPSYRGNIFFIDDSQIFNGLQQMVNEYKEWGQTFAPNYSGFQFGYNADKHWWSEFDDPPKTIGQSIIDNVPGCKGVFWVDFTVTEIFPLALSEHQTDGVASIGLNIFPNPVTGLSKVRFKLNAPGFVNMEIVDATGRRVFKKDLGKLEAGEHRIAFKASQFDSGIYFVKVITAGRVACTKFVVE